MSQVRHAFALRGVFMSTGTECRCGKIRYLTKAEAKHAARGFKGRGAKGTLRAYKCDGGFWHLTSLTATQLIEARRRPH
jgi:hypothetical protein